MQVGECWNFGLHSEIFSQNTSNYTELFNIYNSGSKTSHTWLCYLLQPLTVIFPWHAACLPPPSPNKSALEHLSVQFFSEVFYLRIYNPHFTWRAALQLAPADWGSLSHRKLALELYPVNCTKRDGQKNPRCQRRDGYYKQPPQRTAATSANSETSSKIKCNHLCLFSPIESESHRMVGVGRDLCGSSSPTPCRSRVTYSRLHRTTLK